MVIVSAELALNGAASTAVCIEKDKPLPYDL